jgi:hypothetical protein
VSIPALTTLPPYPVVWRQIYYVMSRTNTDLWRDTETTGARFIVLTYLAIILGELW